MAKTTIDDILGHSSPRPWVYHQDPRGKLNPRDWIADDTGNVVLTNVGHLDGPLICAAVNFLYLREAAAEAAVRAYLTQTEDAA